MPDEFENNDGNSGCDNMRLKRILWTSTSDLVIFNLSHSWNQIDIKRRACKQKKLITFWAYWAHHWTLSVGNKWNYKSHHCEQRRYAREEVEKHTASVTSSVTPPWWSPHQRLGFPWPPPGWAQTSTGTLTQTLRLSSQVLSVCSTQAEALWSSPSASCSVASRAAAAKLQNSRRGKVRKKVWII